MSKRRVLVMSDSYNVGDIKKASELGYKWSGLYTYKACIHCDTPRWVRNIDIKKGINKSCRSCVSKHYSLYGEKSSHWKGGRSVDHHGYVWLTIKPDDPYHSMTKKKNNEVSEHRYVMAKHLERTLESYEIVHHKNHNKQDNRIDNLEIISHLNNISESLLYQEIIDLRKENEILKNLLKKRGIKYE